MNEHAPRTADDAASGGRRPKTALLRRLLRGAGRCCSAIEGLFWGNAGPDQPPLFIVGLPRGGTTLIYQAVCQCMSVAHPTELTNWMPMCPSLATWLSRRRRPTEASFRSRYGRSSRLGSPGEGLMWNLWLDKHSRYDGVRQLTGVERREVARVVGRIERIGGGAFVNKNLRHNQRIRMLAELFPKALFLVVVRSPLDVAVSLLRGRREQSRDPTAWFSIRPRAHALIPAAPAERAVVLQVEHLLRDLEDDIAAVGTDRCRVLDYERFCAAPRAALEALSDWAAEHGADVALVKDPPAAFTVSHRKDGVSEESLAMMRKWVAGTEVPELRPELLTTSGHADGCPAL